MRTMLLIRMTAAAGALALAACEGPGGARELTAENNGETVRLKLGQELRVALDENPSTGYRWETEFVDEAVLRFEGRTYRQSPACPSEMVGCPGTATLRYTAVEVGQTVLRLVERRPWEEGWIGIFEVTVIVGR